MEIVLVDQDDKKFPIGGHYRIKFIKAIKRASNKDDFKEACHLWEFDRIVDPGTAGKCICTHDISVDYIIKHKKTKEELTVGCDCIENFFENEKVVGDVKEATAARKRRLQGKSPAVKCRYCGKTVPRRKRVIFPEKKPYHESCQMKNYENKLKNKYKTRELDIKRISGN